jgi:hypothetical protein
MALTLAKVKDNRVRLSAAGMPPALVYRAATGTVEEVAIRGMPLGGAVVPYEERELELEPGDALVFMSDGFPERFNASGEMLDYDRARDHRALRAHGRGVGRRPPAGRRRDVRRREGARRRRTLRPARGGLANSTSSTRRFDPELWALTK